LFLRLAIVLLIAWTAWAAPVLPTQVRLSWNNSGSPVTVLTTTQVVYSVADYTATTNRVRQNFYSPTHGNLLGNLMLQSWATYYSSLQDHTLITGNMLTNWAVLTTTTSNSLVQPINSSKRFFAVFLNSSSSLMLAWDASTSSDVTGYRLSYGGASGQYTNSIQIGNQTAGTIDGLAEGHTYYFTAKAIGSTGLESLPSNEVAYTMKRTKPLPVTISR